MAIYKTRNTKTECGKHGKRGKCHIPAGNVIKYCWEYPQRFWVMSSNILENILKHSCKCRQTFRLISPNMPGNIAKHSGEFPRTFGWMSRNNPGNVVKHSDECPLKNFNSQNILPEKFKKTEGCMFSLKHKKYI